MGWSWRITHLEQLNATWQSDNKDVWLGLLAIFSVAKKTILRSYYVNILLGDKHLHRQKGQGKYRTETLFLDDKVKTKKQRQMQKMLAYFL